MNWIQRHIVFLSVMGFFIGVTTVAYYAKRKQKEPYLTYKVVSAAFKVNSCKGILKGIYSTKAIFRNCPPSDYWAKVVLELEDCDEIEMVAHNCKDLKMNNFYVNNSGVVPL